jgi:hypothetical protein
MLIAGLAKLVELVKKPALARAELNNIRETVRERYAAAATKTAPSNASCCAPIRLTASPTDDTNVFGGELYDESSREGVPDSALDASLGCGVPTAVADLHEGETVLDLGPDRPSAS